MTTDTTTTLVLNTVTSAESKRAYSRALSDFNSWRLFHPGAFTKALVQSYKADLLAEGKGAVNVNLHLTAIRKLAAELADNGQLPQDTAASIQRVKGERREGVRLGNWLSKQDAQVLLNSPDTTTLKGKRDRALLAVLVGCGLRRAEASSLTCEHIQQREGRWVIADLTGKRNKTRSIPMPSWCKAALDAWRSAAGCNQGYIFRSIRKGGKIGGRMTAQAVYNVVQEYSPKDDDGQVIIAPHDLRRTFAKLAHKGGSALEQIQLSLGHASIKTTEIYLGVSQNLTDAPCDRLGLEL